MKQRWSSTVGSIDWWSHVVHILLTRVQEERASGLTFCYRSSTKKKQTNKGKKRKEETNKQTNKQRQEETQKKREENSPKAVGYQNVQRRNLRWLHEIPSCDVTHNHAPVSTAWPTRPSPPRSFRVAAPSPSLLLLLLLLLPPTLCCCCCSLPRLLHPHHLQRATT